MGILLNTLPKSVEICGSEVPIAWDFRTSINFSELLLSKELDEKEQITKGAKLYYGPVIYDFSEDEATEAIEKMLWFYKAGEMQDTRKSSNKKQKQTYSFDQDGDYIYAAFREQFNVDLSCADLHWWSFRAMFGSISASTQFGKILGYRTIDINKVSNKEDREFYRMMKKEYALDKKFSTDEDKLIKEINDALMRGEDVSHLLKG